MMISETFKLLRQGKEKVIKKKKTNKNPSLFLRMFKRQKINNHLENDSHTKHTRKQCS